MNPAFFEQGALRFIKPAAVCCDGAGRQDSAFIKETGRALSIPRDTIVYFPFSFRKVDVNACLLVLCKLGTPLQTFRRYCVDRMRPHSSFDPGIIQGPDMCDKVLGCFTLVLALLCTEEIDEPVRQHCTHSGFIHCPGCIGHKEVHIIECSCTAPDHLKTGKTG